MNSPPAETGAPVAEIETPALVLDLDAFERNIAGLNHSACGGLAPA
jgi:D-serine deaminase-like pyridoxal phosphate-dependent protein